MRAWITPGDAPITIVRRVLEVPDSIECVTIVYGALLTLAEESNWEQDTGITPAEAAALFRTMFDAFLNGEVCP